MAASSFTYTVWVASCHDFSRLESRSHRDRGWKAALTGMAAGKPLSEGYIFKM